MQRRAPDDKAVHWIGANLVMVLWSLAAFVQDAAWEYLLAVPLNLWIIVWLWMRQPPH
jgi:hypothetical protein